MRIYYTSLLKKIVSIPVSYYRRAYGLIVKQNVSSTGSLNVAVENVSNTYDSNVGRAVEQSKISELLPVPGNLDIGTLKESIKSTDLYYVPVDTSQNTEKISNIDYKQFPVDISQNIDNIKNVDYQYANVDASKDNVSLSNTELTGKDIDIGTQNEKISKVEDAPAILDRGTTNTTLKTTELSQPELDKANNSVNTNISSSDVSIDKANVSEKISEVNLIDANVDKSNVKTNISVSDSLTEVDKSSNQVNVGSITESEFGVDKGFESNTLKSVDLYNSRVDISTNDEKISNVTYIDANVDKSNVKESFSNINTNLGEVDKSSVSMSFNLNYANANVDLINETVKIGNISIQGNNGWADIGTNNVGLSSKIDPSSRVDFNPGSIKNYVSQFHEIFYLTGSTLTSSRLNYTDDLEFTVIGRNQSEQYKDNLDYNIPYRASFVTRNWPYYTFDTKSYYNLPKLFNASDTVLLASRDIWITASFENGNSVFTDEWGFAIDL